MVKDKTFAEIVAWAMRNNLWESYHLDARRQLDEEYAGSGQGIGTSDINCRAVDSVGADYRVLIEEGLDLLDIVTFTSDRRVEEDGNPVLLTGYVCDQAHTQWDSIVVDVTDSKGHHGLYVVKRDQIVTKEKP